MKRVFAFAFAALLSIGAFAQEELPTFQLFDKNDNPVADGATLVLTEGENLGAYQNPSGLYLKNNSDDTQGVGIDVNLISIDNGTFSCCFPMSCRTVSSPGVYENYNVPTTMDAGEERALITEWIPSTYGSCTAELQFKVFNVEKQDIFGTTVYSPSDFKEYGPKVKLHFVYADPTSVNGIKDNTNTTVVARYNANGMSVKSEVKGLNIIRLSNGKTIKQIKK